MARDDRIAVGVPVYSRDQALEQLLESIPEYVSTVYVADNGPPTERDRPAYEGEYSFALEVLDLAHDVGIGACRNAIARAVSEPYLWVGDCDMAFVRDDDLRTLRAILDAHDDLGGVSGWLLEDRAVRAGARDLVVRDGVAIKEAADPDGRTDPYPHYRFDFIPQAALFRSEIFDTYAYDPAVRSTEHFDFFYAHSQLDEWEFASTPVVTVRHDRNIDREYRESQRGGNHVDQNVLAEKWGIERIEPGAAADWAEVHDRGLKSEAFDLVKRTTPPAVWLRIKAAAKGVGLA